MSFYVNLAMVCMFAYGLVVFTKSVQRELVARARFAARWHS